MPEQSGDLQAQKRKQRWVLTGVFDPATALNYAIMGIPVYHVTEALFRQNITPSSPGGKLWYFDVEYGPVPMFAGTWSFGFDTTGGTLHVSYSKECIAAYVPAGAPAVTKGLEIGLNSNGAIDGTEMVVPATKLSYTYRKPRGIVNEAYVRYITSITGVVNSVPWHGFAAGELLFLGMRGTSTYGAEAETSLTFEIVASPNMTNQTYGDATSGIITGIAKKGHHFLDVTFVDGADTNADATKTLKSIHIHRMYQELDFGSYLGF
jgi:hypothetical protein